ncbi:MAG: DUF2970 domain-containing protein [Marinobacterium sp.]|nr:DUF2970 domain-containing protein [Marinobacterium sp.]
MPSPDGPSFWQMLRSAFAALFGVQSEQNRQRDFNTGQTPGIRWQWLLTGLVVTGAFIVFVMLMVQLALSLAGA